ncbi:MAG: nitroreductase [Sphingobacteriales bacterium]|nr:nitroreductase [Sphingobacteriales bacterium]
MIASINTVKSQNPDFLKIIEYGIKAPSGHNTQPWKFKLKEKSIEIHPNLDKTLPVVDGNHRELYISLGCALENICVAASNFGYTSQADILQKDSVYIIEIKLQKTESLKADPLFSQIEKRQTNRSIFKSKMISADTLVMLQRMRTNPNVSMFYYKKGEPEFETLSKYIYTGNEIFYNDKAFRKEVLTWMRFNKKDVLKQNDGLAYNTVGSPSLPKWLGRPIVSSFLTPKKQNKSEEDKIKTTSHFVTFTTNDNTPKGWILTGQSLENYWLHCTELGIAVAFSNQPCESASLASEISKQLPINNELPMLLLRIGYADPMPYSVRKTLKDVIIE